MRRVLGQMRLERVREMGTGKRQWDRAARPADPPREAHGLPGLEEVL